MHSDAARFFQQFHRELPDRFEGVGE
jgi:hypothetical protein